MEITLKKSDKPQKKFAVKIDNKTIHFGSRPNKDFTLYSKESKEKAQKMKNAYISRHRVNENWNKDGLKSAGFWSKHILWNKPTIQQSIKDTEKRFNIKIKYLR
tara:strand:+ start:2612 stop:2923 length:312 start_codon:yes stop_codon:yes gene_type:complete